MQKNIRYIAVDDNPIDLLLLKEYAASFPFLEHCGSFSTPAEGLAAAQTLLPDLVFLDIEMPDMTGLEVLRQLKDKVAIAVFITSHPEFALEGFQLSALDYILKPLTSERFAHTANRIQDFWQMKQKASAYEILIEAETLTIKEGYNLIKLPLHEITYLEAMQDYTKVVTDKKKYLVLSTLTAFLERLPEKKYQRIHRSYAVAINKIKEIGATSIVCGSTHLPVGKTYRSTLTHLKTV